jgi:hypothetical protein
MIAKHLDMLFLASNVNRTLHFLEIFQLDYFYNDNILLRQMSTKLYVAKPDVIIEMQEKKLHSLLNNCKHVPLHSYGCCGHAVY